MKKIIISLISFLLATSTFSQLKLISVDQRTMDNAVVEYAGQQITVTTVYLGHPGNGLMLNPPIIGNYDQNGNYVDWSYCPGMTSNHAVVWIVKGTPAGNGQWGWSISKVTPLYNNFTPSPSAWENLFPNGKIPDGWYAQPSVRITNEGNYFIDAL